MDLRYIKNHPHQQMETNRLCFALDLKDDPKLIQEYIGYHKKVWPEIIESIQHSGILEMEIYQVANRLFMIMEVQPNFSLKAKGESDKNNPIVQEWETLMNKYQKILPGTPNGVKWVLMNHIFKL